MCKNVIKVIDQEKPAETVPVPKAKKQGYTRQRPANPAKPWQSAHGKKPVKPWKKNQQVQR